MFKKGELVNCMACEICFSKIIKPNQIYCKKCQVKARCNKTYDRNAYNIRVNKNFDNMVAVLSVAKKYIEPKYSSKILNDNSNLSIIQYTHKANNIHNYEWSNFQKVEQFGDFIINSKNLPILEYIFRWGDDLQTIPRIQSFMKEHNISKEICSRPKSQRNSVIARPLLLVAQETFWKTSFDPKTASESLLSAIFFAGFVVQYNLPEEVTSYMHAYAIINIKKCLFKVNISSAQALGIYSYAYYLNGNSSQSRVCLSHFARMNHALGININRKKLSVLDQYNRKLIKNNMRLYYNWAKLGPSSYSLASEDNENDLDVYDPKFQLPNPSLNLCNNSYEGSLYSIFCCHFAKIKDFNVNNISKFCKYGSIKSKIKTIELKNKANEIYKDAKLTFESLANLAPEYKIQTSIYLKVLRAVYLLCILCIYSKMLEISKRRDLGIIKFIFDKTIELWELISSNAIFNDLWSWGPYVVGFHLIQIYPHCSKKTKEISSICFKIYY
ncbi:hypothetical protein CONCODRAFT_11172 [Conidiobolus coronatus NRRL 28638]|uniref:Transcription factor domain-containing protein n=1 Tax=Conidiobolus coronatus (strain ATCC 28846 / CBS 209.66 / NRRL 28638) TaxID=796925 RepID=A0A137NVT7_CONC2|nr:hypothetical protein CONCODRAFT_11172 [Conidiobolus coronatus NRRL 28638]|eukprot:KXN66886.1 hypothetical protein CONCODRAFT_11172 [Conidiobolus coronatus NRRL 28638]